MTLFPASLLDLATETLTTCRSRGETLAVAESCTGGLIAALLTEIPGSSAVFTHGFITYANAAKIALLGVAEATLATHGAVSRETAMAMAEGALRTSGAEIALASTGIAGPGGATASKPIGLVYLACARRGHPTLVQEHHFTGERTHIRLHAVEAALRMV